MPELTKIIKYSSFFTRSLYSVTVLVLVLVALLPLLSRQVDAAQITSRSVTLSTGEPSATNVIYSYAFTLPTTAFVQSMQFQACAVAVGTCGTVAGININQGSQQGTNGFTSTTAFTRDATGGATCTPGNQVLCIKRTQASNETGAKTIAWNTQTNPSSTNVAFFIRMTTYSDTGWTTAVDTGTVASAIIQSLTINAAVAEILNFCVGSTAVDDATTDPTASGNHDCTVISGTSVNLGTLDSGHVNITPVSTNCTAGDCNKNGIAMVRSNASNGVTVYYAPIAQSGTNHTKALRVTQPVAATCDATNPSTITTDQCFQSAGWNGTVATQTTLTANTEAFGMTIAGINCGSTSSYTCTFSSGTYNLTRTANYDGTGGNTYNGTDKDQITGTSTNGYAWDESANPISIASSSGSATKVVDDEAMILKFASTPSIPTPFGAYTAQSTFIAVPVY